MESTRRYSVFICFVTSPCTNLFMRTASKSFFSGWNGRRSGAHLPTGRHRALGGSQIPGAFSSVVGLRMDVGEKCLARAVSSELLRRQRELDRDRRSASKASGALEVR